MELGFDISTYLEEEKAGAKYFDNGVRIDPLLEFKKNGGSLIRLRVWNNPYSLDGKPYYGGTSDLASTIEIINKTKHYGFSYIIDFHYSDFWCDPSKQTLPKAWKNLSLNELKEAVKNFTYDSLKEIKKTGVNIPYVQIGNEITNGMLWPVGKLFEHGKGEPRTNYENFAELLKAGIEGAKAFDKNIETIIHLERSNDYITYEEVFSNLKKYEVNYDIIGMSYYPYWHGTFKELFFNINNLQKKFGKDVMIMELGYGFTFEDYILTNNGQNQLKINKDNLGDINLPYEISPKGQAEFIEEFLKLCIGNQVKAVVYWEPLWLPGENIFWASREGQTYIDEHGESLRNEWSNQCLFDYSGNKLPGFDKFKL